LKKFISYFVFCFIIFVCACSVLFNLNKPEKKETKKLTKVKVSEVAHTIFYAPQYVAIEKGFFKEEGLDIELILSNGADKVSAAVLSGDADIGFSGSEATIYVYNGGEKDYLKTFAQLTQKDGTFIVSREKIDNFKLDDLIDKKIIGGRAGGMPEMTLEYIIKSNNIDISKIEIDTSVAFAAMSGSFIGGNGDFVTLFEPTASEVEEQGYGYVVASLGELGGVVPYTSYSAKSSYIEKNKETIAAFTRAIQKGLDYVENHSDKEVAKVILNQFPDTSLKSIEKSVKNYRKIEAWPKSTSFTKESFDHLQDIMLDYGIIDKKVSYDKLIYVQK